MDDVTIGELRQLIADMERDDMAATAECRTMLVHMVSGMNQITLCAMARALASAMEHVALVERGLYCDDE